MMFKITLLFMVMAGLLFADDFSIGMEYLDGTRGGTTSKIEVDNCPYERCEAQQSGTSEIIIQKKDLHYGVKFLRRSVADAKNPQAAISLINFLTTQIDYKSRRPNDFLLKKMKDEVGIELDEYKAILQESVDLLVSLDLCEGHYWKTALSKHEVIYPREKALVDIAKESCKLQSEYFYLMTQEFDVSY